MKKLWIGIGSAAALVLAFAGYSSRADDDEILLRARLSGFQEVLPKVTDGTGTFRATINGNSISYELTFSNLSTPVFGAHIHFAQRGVTNGGIFAFLCGGAPPIGQAPCPAAGGTVTGTITPDKILALPDQGIAAGDFAAAVRALRSGQTYVNVHSSRYPGGEIRGQVQANEEEGENH